MTTYVETIIKLYACVYHVFLFFNSQNLNNISCCMHFPISYNLHSYGFHQKYIGVFLSKLLVFRFASLYLGMIFFQNKKCTTTINL